MQLSHDYILPFEGITDDFGSLPALVSLWMENGSLKDYLKREFPQLTDPRKLELVSVTPIYRIGPLTAISDTAGGSWCFLLCVQSSMGAGISSYTNDCILVHGKEIVHGDLTGVGLIFIYSIRNSMNCWQTNILVDWSFASQTSVCRCFWLRRTMRCSARCIRGTHAGWARSFFYPRPKMTKSHAN